jgi:methionine-rich copper-binding protein CopC
MTARRATRSTWFSFSTLWRGTRVVRKLAVAVASASLVLSVAPFAATASAITSPCGAGSNAIVCENSKTGTDGWQIDGAGDPTIQGFATDISVNAGSTVSFKISTNSSSYSIGIYRMGYYQDMGARLITTIAPSAQLPQIQPACKTDPTVGLVDCGNWGVSASWAVPSTAVSGVYFALLTRNDTHGRSQIFFVVRNDGNHSAVVVQTSDPTWQAYNRYGGWSLYTSNDNSSLDRAYKVSYNRPFTDADYKNEDWVMNTEYPMIKFLEGNGYDVSYIAGVDTDRLGSELANHKVFVSSGHDEYWSQAQYDHVQAARDAGVNLAFFSGNEVYRKIRWENSIDGSNTPYRTEVSYKMELNDGPADPSGQYTGAWRDNRYQGPPNAGRPENSLTGQLWTVQQGTTNIQVPAADGKMRFWRNTSIARLSAGQTATLPDATLGYEWDEVVDNGFLPAGEFYLSTTTANVAYRTLDYNGDLVGPGTATHHMIEYRAPSGALVFGAGTVQWAYGLDDDTSDGVNVDMQQATVNLLADMGVQPLTLYSTLVAGVQSTDHTGPTTTITSPTSGSFAQGSTATISGTASDTGGGVVAGVEVSTDGGATWHPATGRSSWSYTWTVQGAGPRQIEARATDDSGNIGPIAAGATVTVNCPCSIFTPNAVPQTPSTNDSGEVELGVRFSSTQDGSITGVRFYKGVGNTGTHTGSIWTSTGTLLATGTFTNETASGWQTLTFAHPVGIQAGASYVASYHTTTGHYALDPLYFQSFGTNNNPTNTAPLYAPQNSLTGASNGVFAYGPSQFPNGATSGANYWVDPIYSTASAPDVTPPSVISQTPAPNATAVSPSTTVSAVFSEALQPNTAAIGVVDGNNTTVAGAAAYNATTRTLTFTPSTSLSTGTQYTVTVSGATDAAGNTMSPTSWVFTTSGPRTCPCTVFSPTATPATTSVSDSGSVELGMKFQTSVDGYITGVKFYKGPSNPGTHTGALWTATGQKLAQVTFTGETATGWQTAQFPAPIAVKASTVYVISYHAPSGGYAITSGGFTGSAAGSSPITAPADGGTAGGNGVYTYSSTAAFPSSSFNGSNYWVDAIFTDHLTVIDTTPPTVASTTPASGSTTAAPGGAVSAVFNESIDSSTLTFTVTGSGNQAVAGAVSYDDTTHTATFTPTAELATSASYTASVKASDQWGNAMTAPYTWSFTTAEPQCPCSVWADTATPAVTSSSDGQSIELGMQFTTDVNGWVTGVRFYKGPYNTGVHTGTLWSSAGQKLATVTFTNESAGGWQQANFAIPVAVTANQPYVISYHAPSGGYAFTSGYFNSAGADNSPLHAAAGVNGLYSYASSTALPTNTFNGTNYWVDVVFTDQAPTADTTPPSVVAQTPTADATGVNPNSPITAQFSESVQQSSIGFAVRDSGGNAVSGSLAYDDTTHVATFTPVSGLGLESTYTVSVTAVDLAGNPMSNPSTWSFSTGGVQCPCSIFGTSAAPSVANASDSNAIEVGVKFTTDVPGFITGVSFYKGVENTGTHVGNLWTSTGTLLATGTFTNESATGWQTLTFAQPVQVTAGTIYIASYHTTTGHYAADGGYFASTGAGAAPVHAPSSASSGGNGVYAYGPSQFPSDSFNATNYWVDVVFTQ